jgi:hypothetical protein
VLDDLQEVGEAGEGDVGQRPALRAVGGPHRSGHRPAYTSYTVHTAGNRACQDHRHRQLEVFIREKAIRAILIFF